MTLAGDHTRAISPQTFTLGPQVVQISPAVLLPIEIRDRILALYFEERDAERRRHDGKGEHKRIRGSDITLVCQAWLPSAQRQLFRTIHIPDHQSLDRFISVVSSNFTTSMAKLVRSLKMGRDEDAFGSKHDLEQLLRHLPNLRQVEFAFSTTSDEDFSSLAESGITRGINHLILKLTRAISEGKYQLILNGFPDITSLTLGGASPSTPFLPSDGIIPSDLPSLTTLAIHTRFLSQRFERLRLLSEVTWQQITDLKLSSPPSANHGTTRFESMGPNLTTLRIGRGFDNDSVVKLIRLCPNLERLNSIYWIDTPTLPPSLASLSFVILACRYDEHLKVPSGWKHVKEIKVDISAGRFIPTTFKQSCHELGIRLWVEGIEVDCLGSIKSEVTKIRLER